MTVSSRTVVALLLVALFGLASLSCTRTSNKPPPEMIILEADMKYWQQTKPIRERVILEAGAPFGKVYVEELPAMNRGDVSAWERFIKQAKLALPEYQRALSSWVSIQPPSAGDSQKFHRRQAEAWTLRVSSLGLLIQWWEEEGDDDLSERGWAMTREASEAGVKAEQMRAEMNESLLRRCYQTPIPLCKQQ